LKVVSNSSVLIALSSIHRLAILKKIYSFCGGIKREFDYIRIEFLRNLNNVKRIN